MTDDHVHSTGTQHGIVSSEWEKKELIQEAYDHARSSIIVPQLIVLLEKYARDRWVSSTDLFQTQMHVQTTAVAATTNSELPTKSTLAKKLFETEQLWTKPDYIVVHDDCDHDDDDDNDNDSNTSNDDCGCGTSNNDGNETISLEKATSRLPGAAATTTEVYLVPPTPSSLHDKAKNKAGKSTGTRSSNGGTSRTTSGKKCLLRHKFSTNGNEACSYHYRVCKLLRRHQKEIAKSSCKPKNSIPCSSSSSSPPPSSVFLKGSVGSAVRKYYNDNNPSNRTASCNKEDQTMVMLQHETKELVADALSIVHDAVNLEIGIVPKTSVVRWKKKNQFEICYYY